LISIFMDHTIDRPAARRVPGDLYARSYLRRAQRDVATTLRWAIEEDGRLVVRVPRAA
jgi:hypothetical protein